MHVVAHQAAAEKDGMRIDLRTARLLDAQRGDVEGSEVLAFHEEVGDDRVLAGGELSDSVGKCSFIAERDVIFDDRGLARVLRDDERAGMGCDFSARAG